MTKAAYVKREVAIKTAAKITGIEAKAIRPYMKKGAGLPEDTELRKAVRLAQQIWYKYRKAYAKANAAPAEVEAQA